MSLKETEMKLKNRICFDLLIGFLALTGCANSQDNKIKEISTENAIISSVPQTTTVNSDFVMNVTVDESGYGIDGRDLGHSRSELQYSIEAGDVFYENSDGTWTTNPQELAVMIVKNKENHIILTIEKIEKDDVTVTIRKEVVKNDRETKTIAYGEYLELSSTFMVFDGINYSYKIEFMKVGLVTEVPKKIT